MANKATPTERKFNYARSIKDTDSTLFFPLPSQGLDTKKQVVSGTIIDSVDSGIVYAFENVQVAARSGMYLTAELIQITDSDGLIFDSYADKDTEDACKAYASFLNNAPAEPEKEEEGKRGGKITLLRQLQGDKKLTPPTIEDDAWYVDRDLWYYMLRSMKRKKNVLLIGDSGAGKTELAMMITAKIQKNLEIFDMAVSNPYKTFCGMIQAEDGSTYFKRARFSQAIEKAGVILLDELSRAAPAANNIFLPLLDRRRVLYVEEAMTEAERIINVHEDCMFWATANIGSEYIGTSLLDHALMNRFQMIEVSYPPQDKESLLLQKVCELTKLEADMLASIANDIRKESMLSKDISTRQLMEIGYAIRDGYTMSEAFEYTVLVQFDGGMDGAGERSKVKTIIQQR